MSVDFYHCDCCGDSRYEEYVGECSVCGHELCTSCLVNDDIKSRYAYDYGIKFDGTQEMADKYGFEIDDYDEQEIIDDVGIDSKYCPFCTGLKVHDEELLDYALQILGKTKEEIRDEYIASRH